MTGSVSPLVNNSALTSPAMGRGGPARKLVSGPDNPLKSLLGSNA